MLKKGTLVGVILIVLMLVVSPLFAGGRGDSGSSSAARSHLHGKQLNIGSWWGAYDLDAREGQPGHVSPRNEGEEKQLDYRRKLLADKGFKAKGIELSGWDDYFQIVTNNIMSRNKDIHVYWLSAEWAMTLYKQGLLYPLSDSKIKLTNRVPLEMQKPAYNEMMEKLFTFGGKQYAAGLGVGGDSWQGNFLFWNKRLLREAGLNPDLPYDLQRDGNWNWDTFLDIARRTTRDINNDGITDIYALPCDDAREVMNAFVYGNNANFVTIDAQGRFHNGTNRPEFIEAAQFYLRLMEEGLMKPLPENSAWDWDFTEFFDGKVAMLIAPEWRKGQMGEMADDYGCVVPPKGPRMQNQANYRMSLTENVFVVPNIFTAAEVDDILEMLDLWEVPADTDWKQGHYWAFRDRRAVDETVALTKESRNVTYRNFALIPGFPHGEFCHEFRYFTGNPSQIIEQYAPRINALLADMNR